MPRYIAREVLLLDDLDVACRRCGQTLGKGCVAHVCIDETSLPEFSPFLCPACFTETETDPSDDTADLEERPCRSGQEP